MDIEDVSHLWLIVVKYHVEVVLLIISDMLITKERKKTHWDASEILLFF